MSDRQETIEILVIKQDEKPIRKTIPQYPRSETA